MKKVLSYVIWGEQGRYWNNLAYILLANSAIYPDFHMRFFVHEDATAHFLFPFLDRVAKEFNNVVVETIKSSYKGTQLTTWRMKPLWEADVDYLFCRDMDYAINDLERKSVEYFTGQADCIVHGIRSYHLHTSSMMAGLCGFNAKQMRGQIRKHIPTFNEYINYGVKNVAYCKDWRWGCDQALLAVFLKFVGVRSLVLDCPQFTAPKHIAGFSPKLCLPSEYNSIVVPRCDLKVLAFSDAISPGFTGQAWTCNSQNLGKMMGLVNNGMSDVIREIFADCPEIRKAFVGGYL